MQQVPLAGYQGEAGGNLFIRRTVAPSHSTVQLGADDNAPWRHEGKTVPSQAFGGTFSLTYPSTAPTIMNLGLPTGRDLTGANAGAKILSLAQGGPEEKVASLQSDVSRMSVPQEAYNLQLCSNVLAELIGVPRKAPPGTPELQQVLNSMKGSDVPSTRPALSSPSLSTKKPSSGGIQWLFDSVRTLERLGIPPVAPQSRAASPAPADVSSAPAATPGFPRSFAPASSQDVHVSDPWTFNSAEDYFDDPDLYCKSEAVRRRNPRYLALTERLQDLHIVMPIVVPNGEIQVEDPMGANFYKFSEKFVGEDILFGRGESSERTSKDATSSVTTAAESAPAVPIPEGTADGAAIAASTTPTTTASAGAAEGVGTNGSDAAGIRPTDSKPDASLEAPGSPKSKNEASEPNVTETTGASTAAAVEAVAESSMASANSKECSPAARGAPSPAAVSQGRGRVCDVWASFLHVRLGTIYNVRNDEIPVLCDAFNSCFDKDLCKYYVPIAMECRGVFPSSDEGISQRVSRAQQQLSIAARSGQRNTSSVYPSERYETHAALATENDKKRFRMIRRHLKKFAQDLNSYMSRFGTNPSRPGLCVELHDNCKSETVTSGRIKICVREWSPLQDRQMFKDVWNGRLAGLHKAGSPDLVPVAEGVRDRITKQLIPSARVYSGEIRLEYNHLKMVDPRWPNELVLGRRVADCNPEMDSITAERARFVFCDRLPKPRIRYLYAEPGITDGDCLIIDPRKACLGCRLGELYRTYLARTPNAGLHRIPLRVPLRSKERVIYPNSPSHSPAGSVEKVSFSDVSAGSSQFHSPSGGQSPIASSTASGKLGAPGVPVGAPDALAVAVGATDRVHGRPELLPALRALMDRYDEAERLTADKSALKEGVEFPYPYTNVTCRFFLRGGCARGDDCYFLHPADPKGESLVDVRLVVPKHPKFY